MSLVSEIVERLKAGQTVFQTVAGAIEFSMLEKNMLAAPGAYVMSAEEASGENERATGKVLQRLESDIAVVIVVENLSGTLGAPAGDELEDLKKFVRSRLIGFEPASAEEPVTHVSGALIKASGGTVWFEDVYSAPSLLEQSS
ncbi:phage tail terminator protein [Roseibium sp. SCP14]|uniref:phage tail terminator protein n=1 Tax=Roseibium sp. SCP14 TaxID=3141375 RepID=UPI00333C71AD